MIRYFYCYNRSIIGERYEAYWFNHEALRARKKSIYYENIPCIAARKIYFAITLVNKMLVMRTFIILLLCWTFGFITAGAQDLSAGEVILEKLFTLNEGLSMDDPGYLFYPSVIETDSRGNIYVGDKQLKQVFMFDPEGSFIRTFGRQGRGPGEFNELTDIAITDNDELLVLDRMSFKVARFANSGNYQNEHFFEDLTQINNSTLVSLPGDRLATVYVETIVEGLDMELDTLDHVRIYSFGEDTARAAHLNIFDYWFDEDDKLEQKMGRGIGYHLTRMGDNQVGVGHHVYNGTLFLVDLQSGDVKLTENPEVVEPYYHEISRDGWPDEEDWPKYPGLIMHSGGYAYQILYRTVLLRGTDKFLFHIYKRNSNSPPGSIPWLEVYSQYGKLLVHDTFKNLPPETGEMRNRQFLHIDNNNRLYIALTYYERDPEVVVYRMNVK